MGVLLLPKVGIEINQAMKIDSYLLEKDSIINPDENYIISRDKQGNVVSYYKDAYADHIRTASRLTSGHSAEVDSYTLPIYIRTI